MKRPWRWVRRQTRVRPFLSALVLLVMVTVPGYIRVESIANRASDTATAVQKVSAEDTAQLQKTALASCQIRNTATKHGRDRFVQLFAALDLILVNAPGQTLEQQNRARAFIQTLRTAVPVEPKVEDVDCNRDGVLGAGDYAP